MVRDARVSHGVQFLFCVAAGTQNQMFRFENPLCGCLGFACSAGASRGAFLAVLRGDLGPAGAPWGYTVSGGAPGGHNDSPVPCNGDLMHPPPPYPLYKGFWGVGGMPAQVIVIFLNS